MSFHAAIFIYSGDPNIQHSNTGNIQKLNILMSGIQMVQFSNDRAIALVPTIKKPNKMFGFQMVGFQMVGLKL